MKLWDRISVWFYVTFMGIKPLEYLDSELCPVCGAPFTPDGRHDFGAWVEQT